LIILVFFHPKKRFFCRFPAITARAPLSNQGTILAFNHWSFERKSASGRKKMKHNPKAKTKKGAAPLAYVLVGVVITVGILLAIWTFQQRNHDITVHVPTVDVH
jgi:hypothetical protein